VSRAPAFALVALALGAGCRKLPQDPAVTGIAIWPDAGRQEAPTDLIVKSRRSESTDCEIVVGDTCPEPTAFVEALAVLDPGERVVLQDASCVVLDIACLAADAGPETAPLRTWSWEVLPTIEDDDEDEEAAAFDAWPEPGTE